MVSVMTLPQEGPFCTAALAVGKELLAHKAVLLWTVYDFTNNVERYTDTVHIQGSFSAHWFLAALTHRLKPHVNFTCKCWKVGILIYRIGGDPPWFSLDFFSLTRLVRTLWIYIVSLLSDGSLVVSTYTIFDCWIEICLWKRTCVVITLSSWLAHLKELSASAV